MDSKLFELDAKMDALRAKMASFPARITKDFQERLDVSWIFHDHALEGVVLSYSELKAAVDQRIISDVTLIPMYEEVRSHKQAVDFIREASQPPKEAARGRPRAGAEALRDRHARCGRQGLPLPQGEPASPALLSRDRAAREDRVQDAQARRSGWSRPSTATCTRSWQASRLQFRCWPPTPGPRTPGKVARLLTNYILISNGYLPAIVHSIERQRYYEALRHENDGLTNLILESLQNSIETTAKFYDELAGLKSAAPASRRPALSPRPLRQRAAARSDAVRPVLERAGGRPVRARSRGVSRRAVCLRAPETRPSGCPERAASRQGKKKRAGSCCSPARHPLLDWSVASANRRRQSRQHEREPGRAAG